MQGLTNPEQRIENLEETLNASSAISPRSEYLRITKTLTYSYLFTIPLILLYELGSTIINGDPSAGIRVGADVLVKRLLQFLALRGTIWVSLVVLFIGLLIMIYE